MNICFAGFIGAIVTLLATASSSSLADDATNAYSSDDYAICAACHLSDGVGIPGVFPPIRNRAAAIAKIEGGREYLVTAVSFGLMGNIEVAGLPYFGVMAGNNGMLSADQIANALNFIVFELSDDAVSDVEPFTGSEVEGIQADTETKGPSAAAELRRRIAAAAGDKWP